MLHAKHYVPSELHYVHPIKLQVAVGVVYGVHVPSWLSVLGDEQIQSGLVGS